MIYTRRFADHRRQGVTLIELLIVILVMLMITAVTVPAISPALQGRKIREGARMVEVYLNSARNRAVADHKIVGVMIEADENEPSQCISLSLVEQPDPWAGDFQGSDVAILGNGGFGVWQQLPTADGMGNFAPGVISTSDPIFRLGDVGWVGNIAPGDTFILGHTDMVQYRLYAGEPYIDVNGNGQWDGDSANPAANEPYNDVDANGWYTPPNQATIDAGSGMFIGSPVGVWPAIQWGQPTAFITYSFADPVLAARCMSPFGSELDLNGNYTQPIYLDFSKFDPTIKQAYFDGATWVPINRNQPTHRTSTHFSPPDVPDRFAFLFNRRPVPFSSQKINLPDGVVVDLGTNLVPPGSTNIVGVPGSGADMLIPFSAGNATLGNYATFRPNPICDHETNPNFSSSNVNNFNRPLIITFDPSGVLGMVHSWDERHFVNSTGAITPTSVPNFSDYQGRYATSPIYLLVGKRELIDGDPDVVQKITDGAAPLKPAFNMQDPDSLWISISPRTGLITSAENVAPDLTVVPPGTSATQLQLYFNAQTYQARSIAREAYDMGGK